MVGTNASDYRHSNEAELLAGLRAGHPLALAEAYHRTVAGVHAAARRLLGSPRDVEDLLSNLYGHLWAEPPQEPPLEGWLRGRCFSLGSAELRSRAVAPAAASLGSLLPDLPRPSTTTDALERELSELDEMQRLVLVAAFDQGRASLDQDQAGAPAALDLALRTLAGPDPPGDDAQAWSSPCRDIEGLADWTLGLLGPEQQEAIGVAVAERDDCHARARRLRRGRRRLEGLPPPPDVGQRVIARVLAQGATVRAAPSGSAVGSPGAAAPAEQSAQPEAAPAVSPHTPYPAEPGPAAEPDAPPTAPSTQPASQVGATPVTEPGNAPPAGPPTTAAVDESLHEPLGDLSSSQGTPTEAPPNDTAPAQAPANDATPSEAPPNDTAPTGAPAEAPPNEATATRAPPSEPPPAPPSEPLQEPPAPLPGRAAGPGRHLLRRVVGVLVVLLVLAVGAAVGLAIGLLIVGGL